MNPITAFLMAMYGRSSLFLRLGKLQSVRGAGMFFIIPILDRVIAIIDGRIQTTAFNAEQDLAPSERARLPAAA
jgi:hypothetical protein